jgi:hypothetical protein
MPQLMLQKTTEVSTDSAEQQDLAATMSIHAQRIMRENIEKQNAQITVKDPLSYVKGIIWL